MKKNTKLIHIQGPEKETGSVVQPIHTSTIFAMENPSSSEGFQYSRVGNPTRNLLERTLADLEGARHAAVFSSGSAALTTIFFLLKKGDTILVHTEVYEGTIRLLENVFHAFGINVKRIDMKNLKAVKKELSKNIQMVLFESPTNPTLEILDIKNICFEAKKRSIPTVVDNTLSGPMIQLPLKLGANIVIESMTKCINGHSDVLGGLIATSDDEMFKKIKNLQITTGSVLSPTDCHMILRSLKTLRIRVSAQQKSAKKIAQFLAKNKAIEQLHSPRKEFLPFLTKQMKGPGSIISFSLCKENNSEVFINSLRLILIAHSFGGVETVIQQPARMMDLGKDSKLLPNFFRLSVGLEDTKDIIDDLKNALDQSKQI